MKKELDRDFDFYYDLAKFEVEMLNSRSNLFLVFHSLLLAGTAQIWSLSDPQTSNLRYIFSILGGILAVVWAYLSRRTYKTEVACYEKLNEYEKFILVTGETKRIGIRHISGILLPGIVFLCWLSIALLNFSR